MLESERTMSNWTAWDWIAYGCLGIAAFGLAMGAIWKENPAMFENWPLFFSSPKWSFVPMALFNSGNGHSCIAGNICSFGSDAVAAC